MQSKRVEVGLGSVHKFNWGMEMEGKREDDTEYEERSSPGYFSLK